MADPDHVPEMDTFDQLTVGLYRAGLVAQALGLGFVAVGEAGVVARPLTSHVMLAAVALSVANLHLYDKRIRWTIVMSGWIGAVALAATATASSPTAEALLHYGGLGFLFVVTSALALKERFCFKLPGLQAVPVVLAASVFIGLAGFGMVASGLLSLAGAVVGLLAVAKLRMPLHYDVGDKANYQV